MDTSIVGSMTGVFSAIMEWIGGAIETVIPMFYTPEAGLTFIGVLSVVALGISLFFLIFGLIQNLVRLRG